MGADSCSCFPWLLTNLLPLPYGRVRNRSYWTVHCGTRMSKVFFLNLFSLWMDKWVWEMQCILFKKSSSLSYCLALNGFPRIRRASPNFHQDNDLSIISTAYFPCNIPFLSSESSHFSYLRKFRSIYEYIAIVKQVIWKGRFQPRCPSTYHVIIKIIGTGSFLLPGLTH